MSSGQPSTLMYLPSTSATSPLVSAHPGFGLPTCVLQANTRASVTSLAWGVKTRGCWLLQLHRAVNITHVLCFNPKLPVFRSTVNTKVCVLGLPRSWELGPFASSSLSLSWEKSVCCKDTLLSLRTHITQHSQRWGSCPSAGTAPA